MKQSIYQFGPEDRSVSGNAQGAIINDRLTIPVLKAIYEWMNTNPDIDHITNELIEEWLEPKLNLEAGDLQEHRNEVEWTYRVKWALDRLKNNLFVSKVPKKSKAWRITEAGVDFLKEYNLIDSDQIESDLLKELIKLLRGNKNSTEDLDEDRKVENVKNESSLNQILYGPPGTGKTYSTIDKVVEICHANYQKDNHEHNKLLYDQLVKEGRVVFTTFHQSMSYEDFIEGIKPVKPGDDDTYLKYDIEPGVFKQIANTAKTPTKVQSSNVDWDNVNYFKMSIGGKNRPDIHNWCIENNVVGLSWGGEEDLSSLISEVGVKWENYRDSFKNQFPKTAEENRYHIQASYILNKMKIGDIVVISKGNHIIDAIGKITGEYFFDDATPTDMYHFRKVEWIVKDMEAAPEKFIDKQISQQSIYEFYNVDVKKEAFRSLTSKTKVEEKPYVLVIDEINRGNVSAIFGELITLIEDDKRLGAKNELTVTLPYSKEKFGVPSNLHIIGTMNTADRSVEALDTALRRRFTFEEMLPNPTLLKGTIEGISLEKLLRTINERIEVLVDRDHTIGHAFFINDTTLDHLRNTFANKVIPLLQEYFYGDYSKMEMVIGSAFFDVKETSKVKFAVKSDSFDLEGKVYHIKNIASKEVMSDEAFKTTLEQILSAED